MRRSACLLLSCCLTASLLRASSSAWAAPATPPTAPTPSAADAAEAKRHFDLGLKLYKEKLYEPALTEFLTSYGLNSRPSALRNAAQSQRDLRHFAEAHALFTKLLAVHGPALSPAERDAVKRALVDLELLTGTLQISVSDPDAEIEIDGKSVGKSPLDAPVRVDVGNHKVKVTRDGREPWEKSLMLAAQQSVVLDVVLVKEVKTGTLSVTEKSGRKIHVFVDDVDRGTTPLEIDLSAGVHVVELRGEGLASERKSVEISRKAMTNVALVATAMKGRLRVETLGKQGAISVDGDEKGEGQWEGELPVGSHTVRVVRGGFAPYEHLVVVRHGETIVDAVNLVPSGAAPVPFPYRGLYGKFALFGAFNATGAGDALYETSNDGVTTPACSSGGPGCRTAKPIGAAGLFGVGYAFDWVGVELVGSFMGDYRSTDRTWTGADAETQYGFANTRGQKPSTSELSVNESFTAFSIAGYLGLGGRLMSKDDAVRFTFGASVGAAYRSVNLKRQVVNQTVEPGAVTRLSPTLLLDAGLLFGSTPGTKFSLGVVAWLEFVDAPLGTSAGNDMYVDAPLTGSQGPWSATVKTPAQSVLSGTQFYIGPALGLQFGR